MKKFYILLGLSCELLDNQNLCDKYDLKNSNITLRTEQQWFP